MSLALTQPFPFSFGFSLHMRCMFLRIPKVRQEPWITVYDIEGLSLQNGHRSAGNPYRLEPRENEKIANRISLL
jgi:hypothetical protein